MASQFCLLPEKKNGNTIYFGKDLFYIRRKQLYCKCKQLLTEITQFSLKGINIINYQRKQNTMYIQIKKCRDPLSVSFQQELLLYIKTLRIP